VAYRDGSAAQIAAEALIRLVRPSMVQVGAALEISPASSNLSANFGGRRHPVKVSVVLPTYNHLEYLPAAIKSVLEQTYTNFELIIVNDGSGDGTADFLATIKEPRVHVLHQHNQGLPNALNRGFDEARGEYWTWTSADNLCAPNWLEELVKALDSSSADVGFALSAYAKINEQGQIVSVHRKFRFELASMLAENSGSASFLYRSEVARKVGKYDPGLTGAEDWDMWIRMAEVTQAIYVDTILYYYQLNERSMTRQIPDKVRQSGLLTVRKYLAGSGGNFDVLRIYPELHKADPRSQWEAKVRLADLLMRSEFCPVEALSNLISSALGERYEIGLAVNGVRLCCLMGHWNLAAAMVKQLTEIESSPVVRHLADLVSRHDSNALRSVVPSTSAGDPFNSAVLGTGDASVLNTSASLT
jgi:glycosyltransferase involved in cell wall biosynthesis